MKMYATKTNAYAMFVSVHADGMIVYATDGEIDGVDLHAEFKTVESARAWLETVEDDSAFTIFDGDNEKFWEGVEIIAEVEV